MKRANHPKLKAPASPAATTATPATPATTVMLTPWEIEELRREKSRQLDYMLKQLAEQAANKT